MPTFSQAFRLHKSQPELDFVDVSLLRDNKLFLDPFAIAQELDRWSQDAATTVGIFFQQVIDDIRGGTKTTRDNFCLISASRTRLALAIQHTDHRELELATSKLRTFLTL